MFRCQELNAFTLVMLHKAIDFFLFPQTSMKTGYMGSDMNFFEAGSEYDCIIFDLLSEWELETFVWNLLKYMIPLLYDLRPKKYTVFVFHTVW